MARKKIDWAKLRIEFETTGITKTEISRKYGCCLQAVTNNSKGWTKCTETISKAENDIIETYKAKHKDNIIQLEETKQGINRKLDGELQKIVFDIPGVNLQHKLKAIELLGKRTGYFAEDNKQRNPYGGLSQEEINKKLREKMSELGFGR